MKHLNRALTILLSLVWIAQVTAQVQKQPDGVNIPWTDGTLSIRPLAENAVRIKFYKGEELQRPEWILVKRTPQLKYKLKENQTQLRFILPRITVILDKQTGALAFADTAGNIFLREQPGSRKLTPNTVLGEPCYAIELSFISPTNEIILGLGQFQDGHFNLRGLTRRLIQVNSQISIPFIYSDRGYGLLWHQYGLTDFNPATNQVHLLKYKAESGSESLAEVTTDSGTQKVPQGQVLYTGTFTIPQTGQYCLFLDLKTMGNRYFVAIDGQTVIDFTNFWLPPSFSFPINLTAGEHLVQIICKSDNQPTLWWRPIDNLTTFQSPHAHAIDYVVIYGPEADKVISTFRKLSGEAPLLPKWAYGFWQCRERYSSAKQLVDTVMEFRARRFPLDVIVQDWQYWGNKGWGVPEFDEKNYPEPARFIKQLHDQNAHFCISIWSNPNKNSTLGKQLQAANLYIPSSKWLDYFNPETRKAYWEILYSNMFANGVDAWWMDAVEPENDALHGVRTYIGPGDFYRLTYPLMVSRAVYEGQRNTTDEKRVCILTRSAFPGQQRYAAIVWSGDIGANWDTFKRQIVAGQNYCITGLPYWTTDIGGFFRPGPSQYTDEKYHELLIRWFQWGTFNPILRIHGYQSETEPWKYGPKVEEAIRQMLHLRYRLIPYIYSLAWQVTHNGYTLMRPLVMDFPHDTNAKTQPYCFMFGNAFLVAPVIEPGATEWAVYLPSGTSWYNFWTGKRFLGGQTVRVQAPLTRIPLFVRAGSIVPMAEITQFVGEKPDTPLEIRIYPGANGSLQLYEDEGDSYRYEQGKFSTITFQWDDQTQTVKIGSRRGTFNGCLKKRLFNIVWVTESHGVGIETTSPNMVVDYTGNRISVKRK